MTEGKSLSLECLGRGEPRPLVRWSRLGSRQKVEHQTLLHMDSQAVLQVRGASWGTVYSQMCQVLTTHSLPLPVLTSQTRARRDLHLHSTECSGIGTSSCRCQRGDSTEAPWGPQGHRTAHHHSGGWGHRHAALLGHRSGWGQPPWAPAWTPCPG